MPVPVPTHKKSPSHPVVKPQGDVPGTFPSVVPGLVPDDSLKYVIHSACQPAAAHAGFGSFPPLQRTRSDWVSINSFYSGDGSQISFWPGVAEESSDLRRGLTVAGNAAVSKQVHAEACRSPAGTSDSYSVIMGLQHFVDRRPVDHSWAIREHTDDSAISFVARADAWNSARGNAFRKDFSGNSFSSMELDHRSPHHAADELCDNLLHSATTPFADFVDRIVATQGTYASDQPAPDALEPLPADAPGHQQQPVPTEPLSDPTYIRTYRAMAEPLSEWMADYVWKICTRGMSLPCRFVGAGASCIYEEKPPSNLAKAIHSVLSSTLLQPSAILLALWYITRLPVLFDVHCSGTILTPAELEFRKELYGEGCPLSTDERSQLVSRAPFRIALLGCMFANKWLDDHTFSNKTWHSISDVPIQSINRLELTALAVMGHDLSVTPKAWEWWLAHLQQYQSCIEPVTNHFPAPICRPSTSDSHTIVRRMVADLVQLHGRFGLMASTIVAQPIFSSLLTCEFYRKAESCHEETYDTFEIDLDEDGPLREEYVPKRRVSASKTEIHRRSVSSETNNVTYVSPRLPAPSEWSPHADPPLARDYGRRFMTTAPGSKETTIGSALPGIQPYPSSWNAPIPSFATHFSAPRNIHTTSSFEAEPRGFSASTVGPPISYARATFNSMGHVRSFSYSRVNGDDNCCLPPTSCSRYVGQPPTFSYIQGEPTHSRPLWLKT